MFHANSRIQFPPNYFLVGRHSSLGLLHQTKHHVVYRHVHLVTEAPLLSPSRGTNITLCHFHVRQNNKSPEIKYVLGWVQLNQFYCESFLESTTKNKMRCSNSGTETALGK